MVDAVKLGQGLTKVYQGQIGLKDMLTEFEEEMIERGADAVEASREATEMHRSSPETSIAMAEKMGAKFLERMEAHRQRTQKDLGISQ